MLIYRDVGLCSFHCVCIYVCTYVCMSLVGVSYPLYCLTVQFHLWLWSLASAVWTLHQHTMVSSCYSIYVHTYIHTYIQYNHITPPYTLSSKLFYLLRFILIYNKCNAWIIMNIQLILKLVDLPFSENELCQSNELSLCVYMYDEICTVLYTQCMIK